MKNFLLILTLLLCPTLLCAQEYDYSFLSGLRTPDGDILYEMSGHDITAKSFIGSIKNNKNVNTVNKFFKIDKKEIVQNYSDESLSVPNHVEVIQTPIEGSEATINQTLYMLETSANHIEAIRFATLLPRDVEFERAFIKEWLIDQFEELVSGKWVADTVYIAGEMKVLGNACNWQSPHNVYCRGGQVSWSEFSTLEEAREHREWMIAKNTNPLTDIVAEEELEVLFNGIPTVAVRTAHMSARYLSRSPLIVYYVADEFNGHFISCTLSNYGVNRNDYQLHFMLESFMSIPELPHFAWNPFDHPEYEDYGPTVTSMLEDRINFFELGVSMWTPMGDLANVFGASPALNFTFGFPIKNKFAIDLNTQIVFPVNRKEFAYYHNDNYSELTKATNVFQIGGRFRYQQKIAKDWFIVPYIGIGANQISTNLETEESTKNDPDYFFFTTLDLYAGASIRYKYLGLFVEYHNAKYSRSKHILRGFGESAINMGLYFGF